MCNHFMHQQREQIKSERGEPEPESESEKKKKKSELRTVFLLALVMTWAERARTSTTSECKEANRRSERRQAINRRYINYARNEKPARHRRQKGKCNSEIRANCRKCAYTLAQILSASVYRMHLAPPSNPANSDGRKIHAKQ